MCSDLFLTLIWMTLSFSVFKIQRHAGEENGPTADHYTWIQGISIYFAALEQVSYGPRNKSL